MSPPTEEIEAAFHAASSGTVINLQAFELLQMLDDTRKDVETNPESAPNIVLRFLRRVVSRSETASACSRGALAPWQKRKIERYMRDNLERNIRMNELAAEVRLSVSHFCHAFKKSFGDTPHTHVMRLRLDLAMKLMLATGDPLSQIALDCGFADQSHLSTLFRRTFRDSPSAWRRRNRTDAHGELKCGSRALTPRNPQ